MDCAVAAAKTDGLGSKIRRQDAEFHVP